MEFSTRKDTADKTDLYIKDSSSEEYSEQYKNLVKDFYLQF